MFRFGCMVDLKYRIGECFVGFGGHKSICCHRVFCGSLLDGL